jgi:hypothetical protein
MKSKLPTVMDLIAKSIETQEIVRFAESLDYEYTHLWGVRKGLRKLPLEPTLLLCQQHGIESDDAIKIFLAQELKPKKVPPKKRSLLDPLSKH